MENFFLFGLRGLRVIRSFVVWDFWNFCFWSFELLRKKCNFFEVVALERLVSNLYDTDFCDDRGFIFYVIYCLV